LSVAFSIAVTAGYWALDLRLEYHDMFEIPFDDYVSSDHGKYYHEVRGGIPLDERVRHQITRDAYFRFLTYHEALRERVRLLIIAFGTAVVLVVGGVLHKRSRSHTQPYVTLFGRVLPACSGKTADDEERRNVSGGKTDNSEFAVTIMLALMILLSPVSMLVLDNTASAGYPWTSNSYLAIVMLVGFAAWRFSFTNKEVTYLLALCGILILFSLGHLIHALTVLATDGVSQKGLYSLGRDLAIAIASANALYAWNVVRKECA
jgi:hypothetical protein